MNDNGPIQKRLYRAKIIADANLITPNGAAGQYYVQSATSNHRYLAATRSTFPPHGKCNCPDFRKNGERFPCKHVLAAEIYEQRADEKLSIEERLARLERIVASLKWRETSLPDEGRGHTHYSWGLPPDKAILQELKALQADISK